MGGRCRGGGAGDRLRGSSVRSLDRCARVNPTEDLCTSSHSRFPQVLPQPAAGHLIEPELGETTFVKIFTVVFSSKPADHEPLSGRQPPKAMCHFERCKIKQGVSAPFLCGLFWAPHLLPLIAAEAGSVALPLPPVGIPHPTGLLDPVGGVWGQTRLLQCPRRNRTVSVWRRCRCVLSCEGGGARPILQLHLNLAWPAGSLPGPARLHTLHGLTELPDVRTPGSGTQPAELPGRDMQGSEGGISGSS